MAADRPPTRLSRAGHELEVGDDFSSTDLNTTLWVPNYPAAVEHAVRECCQIPAGRGIRQRILDGVFGIVDRAEHSIGVDEQLTPVRFDQRAELLADAVPRLEGSLVGLETLSAFI